MERIRQSETGPLDARGEVQHWQTSDDGLIASADGALGRTKAWLLDRQHGQGYWCGELQGDTILESEYILLLAWLRREGSETARKCADYIVQQQLPDGGWSQYPGGDLDISGSVKAYFALKLTGHNSSALYMQRARQAIIAHGGADAVNSFTRFYLALLGQISYDDCPAVPPEALLLPAWFPISIYRISAWSRTILVPLSIMWSSRPVRDLPSDRGISDLFIKPPRQWPPLRCPGVQAHSRWFSWERFFRAVDRTLKCLERWRIRPLRRRAMRLAAIWMTDRFEDSDGLGAIFPPIVWSVVALKCLGHDENSAELQYCLQQLDDLMIEEDGKIRLQPCQSPVWDTALTLKAVSSAGLSSREEASQRATTWLLEKEVQRSGDWSKTVRAEPAGWFFEHQNGYYPDIDDTAMVMMALRQQLDSTSAEALAEQECRALQAGTVFTTLRSQVKIAEQRVSNIQQARQLLPAFSPAPAASSTAQIAAACERARRWVLAMQNRDGGWGAFDKDNDHEFLCHVPFADHNAMIDPSTPDITGRVIEALGQWGMSPDDASVAHAVAYLRRTQEADGSWFGRWGVNYIYGTWQVLAGLAAVGLACDDPAIQRGVQWLLRHQRSTGGWGESPDSYIYPVLRGQGPLTASQTAWALLGLMAAGRHHDPAVGRGIRYLVQTQQRDGSWDEPHFTGTGFPRVFYLRYHYYPMYFPLLALAQWLQKTKNINAPAELTLDS